jgi:hypothetical protein
MSTDDLAPIEKLAAQLFATFEIESGDIYRGIEWFTGRADVAQIAAWKWVRLAPRLKDAWLSVAEKSRALTACESTH